MQNKRFYSEMLQRYLSFRMTTSVIKQVKRLAGGIDQYLLTTRNEELLFPKAIQIKRNLRRALRLRARDEHLATLELSASGAEDAVAAAETRAAAFPVPALWLENHGGSIGFPWKYGKYWNAASQSKRATMGHASRR